MSLLVVGSVAFDAIETPFGKTDKIVGGAATYITLSSSFFTKHVNLLSVVGGDFPKETIQLFQKRGIKTDGLEIRENEKSFFWKGKYHSDLNTRDTLQTDLNVLADFNPIVPAAYQDCKYLMLGNLTPDIQRSVIQQLKTRPKLIVMDTMNFWMEVALESLKETIKLVDVLTINDEEARLLSGEYSLKKAAKAILQMGPKILIIKKGEHGSLLFCDDRVFFCPALPLEDVYDPTGAGDTFAGGFIGYLAKKNDLTFESLKNAVIAGSAMASFCVQKFGPEALYDLNDLLIDIRMQEFKDLISITYSF